MIGTFAAYVCSKYNRYMYIERHLQHTRIHIKFCYLIAKTLHSLSDIHIQPPQNTAHAFECRALFSIRGIHRFLHIQRRMSITLHYRERRKHFISYRLYARITTEWKTILFLQVLRYAIYSRGSDRSKSQTQSSNS